jgi:hypothetical protein
MLACLLKLLFWRQKEGRQIFEWSVDILQKIVDILQKTESMYIPTFEMVYFPIYKYYLFNLLVVDYFVPYNFCM